MERLKTIFEKLYMANPYIGNACFIDLETTGLRSDARIIEIGAIKTIFDGIDLKFDTFEILINPDMYIDQIITDITGITNDELKTAPLEDEAYPKFINWFNEKIPDFCVAHNAAFDRTKLKANLQRKGYLDLANSLPNFECTMRMSKQLLQNTTDDKLKTLSEYYGFINQQAHRALADTETCAYIFAKMRLGEYEPDRSQTTNCK